MSTMEHTAVRHLTASRAQGAAEGAEGAAPEAEGDSKNARPVYTTNTSNHARNLTAARVSVLLAQYSRS